MADVSRLLEAEVMHSPADAPPGAEPGTCWGRDVTPAEIESVIDHVMIQPPEVDSSGIVRVPAVYRTERVQRIVREREEFWFRTPCAADLTPEFLSSLQRALQARGFYDGPINGQMTMATRSAIRAFQRPQGLDSGVLSLRAARQLGLVAYDLTELDRIPRRPATD